MDARQAPPKELCFVVPYYIKVISMLHLNRSESDYRGGDEDDGEETNCSWG